MISVSLGWVTCNPRGFLIFSNLLFFLQSTQQITNKGTRTWLPLRSPLTREYIVSCLLSRVCTFIKMCHFHMLDFDLKLFFCPTSSISTKFYVNVCRTILCLWHSKAAACGRTLFSFWILMLIVCLEMWACLYSAVCFLHAVDINRACECMQEMKDVWDMATLQYNEPVLKCTELLFYMRFTSSLPTASTSDCLNSSVSFSRAAALSNVPCCINDTISPAT